MNAYRKADLKPSFAGRPVEERSRCGFTLTELLVVLVTLAILAAVLLPALAGTQPRSKAYQCAEQHASIGTGLDALCQ